VLALRERFNEIESEKGGAEYYKKVPYCWQRCVSFFCDVIGVGLAITVYTFAIHDRIFEETPCKICRLYTAYGCGTPYVTDVLLRVVC